MVTANVVREAIAILFSLSILFSAQVALAQSGVSTLADQQCKEFSGKCNYKKVCDETKPMTVTNIGIVGKPCEEPGKVKGTCVAYNVCKGESFTGTGGQSTSIGDIGKFLGTLGQLISALKGGQPPAVGGGGGGFGGGTGGCTQYYSVSQPSSDPCAYYVPTSSSIDTGTGGTGTGTGGTGTSVSDLINALGGGLSNNGSSNNNTGTGSNSNTGSGSGTQNNGATGNNTGTESNTGSGTGTGTGTGGVSSSTSGQQTSIGPGGAKGDIRILPDGTTVVITNQNSKSNSVVAGFLGQGTPGSSQSQGIAAEWCRTRPWATNFMSVIIPPVFFDSLCTLRGFQVGETPAQQGPGQTQFGNSSTIIRNPIPTDNIVPGQQQAYQPIPTSPQMTVDIWASPAAVQLGARTTIFWTSKNAQECVETSPDGSFSQNTLSGGAATVPLSGATTFTISCTAADGTHAADYVTVKLAI